MTIIVSNLLSMGPCSHCGGGHKSPCYAEYVDGYKCFSCGASKSYNNHRMSLMGRTRISIKRGVNIPTHSLRPSEWPVKVLKWLYGYYVFEDLIRKHRIGYIEAGRKLLLPVVIDNEIVFAQTRDVPDKHINTEGDKQLYKIKTGSKKLILVEDYISAIRIGELCDCYCLFGTYIQPSEIKLILDKYTDINVWLDNDKAGIDGAKKMLNMFDKQINENKLRFPLKYTQEYAITNISTEEDPKCYSTKEIEGVIYA